MANEPVRAQAPSILLGFERSPVARQLMMLIGIAAAVAIGVAVVLWSRSPSYQPLFAGLSDKDAAQIMDALQKSGIAHKLDPATGAVLVPAAQAHDARIKLAAQGLPKGLDGGFEQLQQQNGFGTSALMEGARYQRALEGELARSIAAMSNVSSARVHLALPKPTAFGRSRQNASASVLLNLGVGRVLEEGQVAAIVHMIAASVPNLDSSRVTIVDQNGRLLTSSAADRDPGLSNTQLDYTRKLEASYVKRIEDLLTPIAGPGAVRAQVVADVDFTVTEQTQEKFNPAQPALRSEQVAQEQNAGSAGVGGVPGALSNQPPPPATAPETTAARPPAAGAAGAAAPAAEGAATQTATSTSSRATRNFELDKTISHTKLTTGTIRRLSVAVVVDDRQQVDEAGEAKRTPFKPEEIERLTALVKDAVGFSAQRGDSVNVMNIAFNPPGEIEPLPEPPVWQEPWLWEVVKQVGAGLVVLFLIFGILRPVMRGLLAAKPAPAPPPGAYGEEYYGGGPPAMLAGPGGYDNQLNAAKGIASQDPTRVAQVVKTWVGSDA